MGVGRMVEWEEWLWSLMVGMVGLRGVGVNGFVVVMVGVFVGVVVGGLIL